MNSAQLSGRDERFLRRYEYDDGWVIAADLPVDDESVDVDIVGATAIVVIDHGNQVSETEFTLPGPGATVDMKNGVLTITGQQ
ncbi:Hsp20/alpha crystallin family protein [Natronocalculus amylovorans]|uniref:Hsp20/alpha crystallin family protein n=1 Tax=Natronocalculus amylovorans TaxID=2917812 RepID=A0AAE3FYQ5_9EURY|nr:Hsp20/alpha crystallin family protein [Natronocalculus amylovorans]MCL9817838.1 Hsp20/alpha crystallin family protein [Natronocalculus amylovorans]NUE03227.1 Hsp20/alpha crystallin family protein [Halorubraceae archaeon YAN]